MYINFNWYLHQRIGGPNSIWLKLLVRAAQPHCLALPWPVASAGKAEFLQAAAHFKQVLPGYSFCQTAAVEVKVEGFGKLILQLLLFYSKDEKTKRKKQMFCKKFFVFFLRLPFLWIFFPKISCPKVGRWTWPKWPKPSKKFNNPEV